MSSTLPYVSLMIMGKEYRIAIDAAEQDDLIVSAQQLDVQMRKMRDSGNNAEKLSHRVTFEYLI